MWHFCDQHCLFLSLFSSLGNDDGRKRYAELLTSHINSIQKENSLTTYCIRHKSITARNW